MESTRKKSSFSNLYSHPNVLLKDHLQNVGNIAEEIIRTKEIKNKELFAKIAYIIGISHDFAKATTYFQDYLLKNIKTQKANHSLLSAFFGFYLVEKYLAENNLESAHEFLPIIAYITIRSHHGNLPNLYGSNSLYKKFQLEFNGRILKEQLDSINQKEITEIYQSLIETKIDVDIKLLIKSFFEELVIDFKEKSEIVKRVALSIKNLHREEQLAYYFDTLLLFSALIDADKITASGTSVPKRYLQLPENLVLKYKEMKFKKTKSMINDIREQAYSESLNSITNLDLENDHRVLTLTLPTGCGKTLTGLACAFSLRERIIKSSKFDFSPKIIYSLPFLSIIDQNSKVLEDILKISYSKNSFDDEIIPSNLLLKHHHLAEMAYHLKSEQEIIELPINQSQILTESWNSEIVITTFVQFFHSLISYRNKTSRKFHNLINSIIILDEIQSIPSKYWLIVKEMLEYLAKEYNCWIIFMTATNPLIFTKENSIELIEKPLEYYKKFDRITISANLEPMHINDFKTQLLDEILSSNNDIMIVLNTINSTKELYQYIRTNLEQIRTNCIIDEFGIWSSEQEQLFCLSTHLIPKHRLAKIQQIANMDEKKNRRIIITTQLVEAGVDISVDKIYRDFAPLDSLIQASGRCNRNNKEKKGHVKIIKLLSENGREYSSYIYDSTLLAATHEILDSLDDLKNNSSINESEFIFSAVNKYYEIIKERVTNNPSKELLDTITGLNFNNISDFQLIEDKQTIPIFIEVDEFANEIRTNYEEELQESIGFGKKLIRLKYRQKINDYTISTFVSRKDFQTFLVLETVLGTKVLRYISLEKISDWYELDLGLNPKESSSFNMRIL